METTRRSRMQMRRQCGTVGKGLRFREQTVFRPKERDLKRSGRKRCIAYSNMHDRAHVRSKLNLRLDSMNPSSLLGQCCAKAPLRLFAFWLGLSDFVDRLNGFATHVRNNCLQLVPRGRKRQDTGTRASVECTKVHRNKEATSAMSSLDTDRPIVLRPSQANLKLQALVQPPPWVHRIIVLQSTSLLL